MSPLSLGLVWTNAEDTLSFIDIDIMQNKARRITFVLNILNLSKKEIVHRYDFVFQAICPVYSFFPKINNVVNQAQS